MKKSTAKRKTGNTLITSVPMEVKKEVTEVDILWKAYEIYLENLFSLPEEQFNWLRAEGVPTKSDISQPPDSKFMMRQLVF